MKIAIFHLGFFFSGGGEKLVLEETSFLTSKGHKVDIFAPVIDKKHCFPDLIKKFKIRTLFYPFSFKFPLRDFISITGAVFITPFTFLRFRRYDCFFGANQPGPLISFFLSKILKKPYIIYLAQPTRLIYPRKVDLERGFGKGSFNVFFILTQVFKPLVKYLDKISIESANLVLINGKYMAGEIEKHYKVNGIICPAGSKSSDLKRKTKPYILVTNRHFPQKRLDYAILAFNNISENNKDLRMVITGAFTSHTTRLKKLVSNLGLKKKVFFTNLISEKKLFKLYSEALVYVYTSPEEDFGMGVIESMGAGVPVVAWNKGGPKTTIINGKTGFLIKPYSLKEFTKKIELLITNRKENIMMGKNARIHIKKNFSIENHNHILEKALINLLK